MTTYSSSQEFVKLLQSGNELLGSSPLHANIQQNFIFTTEDKLLLCLRDKLRPPDHWVAPASVLATVAATLSTASFREVLLPPALWQAIFLVTAVLTAVWLVRSIIQSARAPDVAAVVREIKEGALKPELSDSGRAA